MKPFRSLPATLSRFAVVMLVTAAASSPADAETTDWAVNEGGRMRLIALAPDGNGDIRAALQIEPAPGWITYWREPGDSGIPPQIAMAPGSKISLEAISYPVPKHIDAGGGIRDFGYDAPVTLPIALKLSEPSTLPAIDAQVFIGLCRNICIPFQAEFSLKFAQPPAPDFQTLALLDTAAASLPEKPGDDFAVAGFALSADHATLALELTLPKGDGAVPEIIVTGPNGYVFTTLQAIKRMGTAFSAEIVIAKLPKNYTTAGKQWRVLVKTSGRAMEAPLVFE